MGTVQADREWLELAADVLDAPPTELPAERIALQLNRSLRGSGCGIGIQDAAGVLGGAIFPRAETFHGHRAEMEEWSRRHAMTRHPIMRHYREAEVQVAQVADVVHDRGVRAEWYGTWTAFGCPEQVALPLHGFLVGHGAFVVARDRPFSEAEMDLARRVRRLVVGIDQQVRTLARLAARPAVATDLRLTPREATVLGLLVQGLTAAAIARRLAVAERTVHKHLEHVYGKLGVRDRLSAVLRAQHLGLLPAPPGPVRGLSTQLCVSPATVAGPSVVRMPQTVPRDVLPRDVDVPNAG